MTPKIVAIGDNVVDCYPAHRLMFAGGNTLNVSVFAARSGATAGYVGAVADDIAGRHIRFSLEQEGVDTAHLREVEGATAYCIIGHREGDRVFLASDLGVSRFQLNAADLDFVSGHDVAHIGRSSGFDSVLSDVAARTRLSYDFSTRHDADHLRRVSPLCFLATMSGGHISEKDAQKLAARAVQFGATWALVTRGAQGAILTSASGTYSSAAVSGTVIDTLGAGDTFIARTLVGLLRGENPDALLAAAAVRATDTCSRLGAFGRGAPISEAIRTAHPDLISDSFSIVAPTQGETHD